MIPVLIPARNEALTIGPIVEAFASHPGISRVVVGLDAESTDETEKVARKAGALAWYAGCHGKGQVIARMVSIGFTGIGAVLLCDADYTGLTAEHIDAMTTGKFDEMVIGVPDFPECDVPSHVILSWPHVSGFRRIPTSLIPPDAHGYLLETQINQFAERTGIPVAYKHLQGLKSPFIWPLPAWRLGEMQRDRQWGEQHGILPHA